MKDTAQLKNIRTVTMGTESNGGIEFRGALVARRKAIGPIRTLSRMISSSRCDVRIEALEALSQCAREIGLEALAWKGIHDRDELVRVTAIELAGEHALKSMQAEIIRRLKSDRSWLVRSAAAVALGDMSAVDARKMLIDRIHLAGDEERVGLYYGLVKLGRQKYLLPFSQGLGHSFYRIRCATANLIPGIVNKQNKRMLIRLLRDALEHEETVAARSSLKSTLEELSD